VEDGVILFSRFSDSDQHYLADMALLAKELHGDQKRWFTDDPYWKHPWAVAELIYLNNGDVDQVAGGYLHDTAEDCGIDVLDLEGYGARQRTLMVVDGLTQRKGESNDDFINRAGGSLLTNMPKRCDTVHNISTLPSGHSLWTKYLHYLTRLDALAVELIGGRLHGNVLA
jgi:hypothetical protein